jgi:hypothetical protein
MMKEPRVSDDGPADPFSTPELPDQENLTGTVSAFYLGLMARSVPEERAAQFTCQFLQTWIPLIMMARAAAQQGQAGDV